MLVLKPDLQLRGKVDAGTDVAYHVMGIDVTQSDQKGVGVSSADAEALSTSVEALITAAASGHHLVLSHIKLVNTGSSTRVVTLYVEPDSTPDDASANVWHIVQLLANEFAEWGPNGWNVYDSNGVPKIGFASAIP